MKPEARTQKSVLKWLHLQHPKIWEHVVKIDNEGKRSVAGHAIAISLGLHVGASDLLIAWPTSKYAGLWLEVKPDGWKPYHTKKERLIAQKNFINKMKDVGYHGDIGVGFEGCLEIINNYLNT
jgi:hypothetical protein